MMIPKTERLRSPRHLSWIRSQPCSVPGCRGDTIEAHHVRKGAGVALKPSDRYATPICAEHHAEGHTGGWRSFEVKHGLDLAAIAARLWAESNRKVQP
jgi:hypothetical protein